MEYSNIQSHNTRTSQNKLNSQKSANTRIFDREMSDMNNSNRRLNPLNRLEIERDEFLKNSLNDDEEEPDFNEFRNPNFNNQINSQFNIQKTEFTSLRTSLISIFKNELFNYEFGLNYSQQNNNLTLFNNHDKIVQVNPFLSFNGNLKNKFTYLICLINL